VPNLIKLIKLMGSFVILLVLYSCQPKMDEGDPIVISSISPSTGSLAGGELVTIAGSGLGFVETIYLGENQCSDVTILSSTSVTCLAPAGSAGIVGVTILGKAKKSNSLDSIYTYQVGPSIDTIDPAIGFAVGGDDVQITGGGFLAGAIVLIGGSKCTDVNVVDEYTLNCKTPPRTAGIKSLTITNPDGQTDTLANAFTYTAAPLITSVSPNGGALLGGTTLTINGSGFTNATDIFVGGVTCNPVVYVSNKKLTCTTGGHAAGAVNVVATNDDGQSSTLTNSFTYRAAPTVSSLSISGGTIYGGTSVMVNGTGFVSGMTVKFGSSSCIGNGYISSTKYYCTTPPGTAGIVDVTVTNDDLQTAILAGSYTYRPAPKITSVSPTILPATLGGTVTITGTDFIPGVSVKIGSADCPVVTESTTSITCTAAPGTGLVMAKVTNADEQFGSFASAITYRAAPTISVIQPAIGLTTANTEVSITGTGFLSGATVMIGTLPWTDVVVASTTSLSCKTPTGSSGLVPVTIENTDLQSVGLTDAFRYQTPAQLEWDLPTFDFGAISTNASHTFTMTNVGEQSASAIAISFVTSDASLWSIILAGGDQCTGEVLASGESCTVDVTFDGSLGTSGLSYTGTLTGTATTGGGDSVTLDAAIP
jgi:hypothetical protein